MSAQHVSRYEPFAPAQVREIAEKLTAQGLPAMPVQIYWEDDEWQKKPRYRDYLQCKVLTQGQIDRMDCLEPTHMGLVVPPGYLILDFDASGLELEALIDRLEDEWGVLPLTTRQATPSGGRHYLFRHPWGEEVRFSSRVHFKDGTEAPVDLLHSGHRFAVIYDPSFPELGPSGLDAVPLIPEDWREAVAYRRPNFQTPALPSRAGSRDSSAGVEERFDLLRKAAIKTRNRTLNLLVFTEVIRGAWCEYAQAACWDAARECGLDDDEIRTTMQSALTAALLDWTWPLTWLNHVSDLLLPDDVFDSAVIVAWKIAVTGKKVIGLSVRELSEHLGVSIASASGYLRSLVEARVLLRFAQHNPEYPWNFKPVMAVNHPLLNTHPAHHIYLLDEGEGGVFTYGSLKRNLERISLTRHSVFQRLGDGPVLSRECARILDALSGAGGSMALEDLSEKTRVGRRGVQRRVRELRRAGLVGAGAGEVSLIDPGVVAALDEWAERHGVPDRRQMREQMYEDQRRQRAEEFRERRRRTLPSGGSAGALLPVAYQEGADDA